MDVVLVWNKNINDRPPRIHTSELCPSLNMERVTEVPERYQTYLGEGTAGWVLRELAEHIPNAKMCKRCTWPFEQAYAA